MPGGVSKIDGIISHVGKAVPVRWDAGVGYNGVWLSELVYTRVVIPCPQIQQLCGIPIRCIEKLKSV